ncbi:MAG: hypothetical protein Kow0075_09420 [Salibacteraceae bacterium]
MRGSVWCWPFGILGSALGVYLFLADDIRLYSEAILYSYYVIIGIYGWWRWHHLGGKESDLKVVVWSFRKNLLFLALGAVCAPVLGMLMDRYFSSNNPYIDASTTIFSFIASYLQAEKVYTSWHFWIVINGVSVWLYYNRGLQVYSLLALIYFVMSIAGLLSWRKMLIKQSSGSSDGNGFSDLKY